MDIDLKRLASDSEENWRQIQALRAKNAWTLLTEVQAPTRTYAVERAKAVLTITFRQLYEAGVRMKLMEPGHGPGHIARDCVNAFSLFSELEGDPRELFIGLVAGTLHDIGCALVERYAEKSRALRHAEVGALLLNAVFEQTGNDLLNNSERLLNNSERGLICLAVASHTHYLKPSEVTTEDGTVRRLEPYLDTYPDGQPIYALWYPRWVDRLDCVGPGFVARHYLTLAKPHQDYTSKGFVDVDFEKHMQPLFDEEADGVHTMLGHMRMFAQSQVDASPYGKHDYGRMQELRGRAREWTEEVYLTVHNKRQTNEWFTQECSRMWHEFLAEKIEPYGKGAAVAEQLQIMFEQLPPDTQAAWVVGFARVMEHYLKWRLSVLAGASEFDLRLPGFKKTIYEML